MNEFMMIFRHVPTEEVELSPEELQASIKPWQDWIGGIAAQGKFVRTDQLSNEGKTLMPNGIVTDGPYAEVKEILGGYIIVTSENLDEAMEIAKGCPIFKYGGHVEVRRIEVIPQPQA